MTNPNCEVTLIDCTGAGTLDPAKRAAAKLLFTKNTRLEMRPGGMAEIYEKPWDEILPQLEYASKTIRSSWEFINYTFMIRGVSRAFTHQFVRTRTGSYAQQTMRILDVDGWGYITGPTAEDDLAYHDTMDYIREGYNKLVENGVAIEDARGVLPTNIQTNIVAEFDLRTIAHLCAHRSGSRTQGEYRDVLEGMRAAVLSVHPWTSMFIDRTEDKAAAELDVAVNGLDIPKDQKTNLLKLIDEMKGVG